MKKNTLALAIASLVVSSSAFADRGAPQQPNVPAVPSITVENTMGGVAGISATVTSSNTGAVNTVGSIGSVEAPANIAGGISNSVGISAVGSSASVTNSSIISNPTASITNNVTVGHVESNNSGDVANISAITGAAIDGGISNSVSISAVGSSAAIASKTIESGNAVSQTGDLSNAVGGGLGVGVDVLSSNSGVVSTDATITGGAGITNSVASNIGANAVGSSASASSTTIADGTIASPVINTMDVSSLTSSNTGAISTVATIDGGSIAGGIGNSVSAAAVGSSASMTNTVIMQ